MFQLVRHRLNWTFEFERRAFDHHARSVLFLGFSLFVGLIAGKPKVRHLGWMLTCWLFIGLFERNDLG